MHALWLIAATLSLSALTLVLVILLLRRPALGEDALRQQIQQALADSFQQQRNEQEQQFRHNRQELAEALQRFGTQLNQQQQLSLASTASQLEQLKKQIDDSARSNRDELAKSLETVRQTVDAQLKQLQHDNGQKLEQMRQTVDEKLHQTLENRLGQSFRLVSERLEQVQKGLGEMQQLASGVGDLKHLLTNVKTRGMFGEAQLEALLEQVFTVDQYAVQVATRPGSRHAVDVAIKLPGKSDDGTPCWLPIDAKFPTADYENLLDAQQRADAAGVESAGKALEVRIRAEAKSIADKYLEPPHTTDFAILFLPAEGLYAEVLRRPGLVDALQREHRIVLSGPTTLLAMLNSLHMGFRTLALEKRSSEVWQVLGAVKTEFGKFGDVLARVKSQTQTVLNTLDSAEVRSRAMGRALKQVEALPDVQAKALLPLEDAGDEPA